MEQVDFCVECARRIKHPLKSKTNMQIYGICIEGRRFDIEDMFDDQVTQKLFHNCPVWADVYNFIRDNQELFEGGS